MPNQYFMVINLKTAKTLGLRLMTADEVIDVEIISAPDHGGLIAEAPGDILLKTDKKMIVVERLRDGIGPGGRRRDRRSVEHSKSLARMALKNRTQVLKEPFNPGAAHVLSVFPDR